MVRENNYVGLEEEPSSKFGKFLAHPPPGEEIVISGISGMLPLSDNIEEFKHNLDNKIEMITQKPERHPEIPPGFGLLKDLTRFDTGFFGQHKLHALTLNPVSKLMLERCYECILDAGLNPSDLKGTNTGVFLGVCFAEAEQHWFFSEHVQGGNAILGNIRGLFANQISSALKLKGPSYVADTACSSCAYALEAAYKAIRMGQCEAALVAGCNCVISEGISLQFARLGVLSLDGHCRPFDVDGNGYVRAEAVVAVLLQKAKVSNRIYATLVHTKTNCDGYKEEGITYPSGAIQYNLLNEIYFESGIKPTDVGFVEVHGTGTAAGDPVELSSVDQFFTPGRKEPLLIGSVKSSIGHSEPVAALCSLLKVILAFENEVISPNINFKAARENIRSILEGRLKVVIENTPFRDPNGLAGLSSFGFGGANAHAIVKQFNKAKIGNGRPIDNTPRLVCVSGRTEEAVNVLLDDVAAKFDTEHMALIHNIFRKPVKNHLYKGYTIVSKDGCLRKSVKRSCLTKPKFYIHFGGLTRISGNLLQDLLSLPLMTNFRSRLADFFMKKNWNFNGIISNSLISKLGRFFTEFLTQLTLAEMLKQLEVESKSVTDHSFGRFVSAYYKNTLDLDVVLECMSAFAKVSKEIGDTDINTDCFVKHKMQLLDELERILYCTKQVPSISNGTNHHTASSPKYFLEGIFTSTQHEISKMPKNSIVLEVGQGVRNWSKTCCNVWNLSDENEVLGILEILGCLYEYDLQPQIQKLYPNVEFPVSRGTPMISPKIKWKHDVKHFVPLFDCGWGTKDAMVFKIGLADDDWASIEGHNIDGRILFPATGYLFLVWSVLSDVSNCPMTRLKVVFENCKFLKACSLSNSSIVELRVMLQKDSGNFEITDNDIPVVTGRIRIDDRQRHIVPIQSTNESCDQELLLGRDIYKELRLRGYNYKGAFRSITQCNKQASQGKIQWIDNWIAFMDNMLQLKILGGKTRQLYVPTRIEMLTINPEVHMEQVEALRQTDTEKPIELPVWSYHESNIIRSGGIEVRGLLASPIPRKKNTALPVLEKYQFVSNEGKLSLEQAVRVFVQIALENNCGFKVKAVELIDGSTEGCSQPLSPILKDALEDLPLVQCDLTVLSDKHIELQVKVENKELKHESECTFVVASDMLIRNVVLQEAIAAASESGFLISREQTSINVAKINAADVLSVIETPEEKLVLMRKKVDNSIAKKRLFINVDTKTGQFTWLEKLKEAVKDGQRKEVILWCQNEPLNGIIGLVNCIRKEPNCEKVRSVFLDDTAPNFDPNLPFYKEQLDKDLGVNIYLNGRWGTYRHLLLENTEESTSEHCYASNTVRGDLSSIKWMEGPLSKSMKLNSTTTLVEVYYAPLNFKDVMVATGRIHADSTNKDGRRHESVQGIEYSGKTLSGRRVMGMLPQGSLATLVEADYSLLWDVPDSWTLKDAATVPVVYSTCLYALVYVGKIKPSDTVLIHSGTGGIGLAAINLCLNMGCTVFITVGTEEKRRFIQSAFRRIPDKNIGNSRNLSFEQMIMKETNGKGVDIILNSLVEEKLSASVRCLSRNGRFLEIGKFDLEKDNQLNLLPFKDGGSYHGVMLDQFFSESEAVRRNLNQLLQKFIDSGAVKPLIYNIFDKSEVEQAYRFMTTGKHMGKVIVEVRNEETTNHPQKFEGLPRYYCNSSKSYVVCGGLGGFGLELANWLVLRGAKNLVLSSRKGITTGYQHYRISLWRNYGCNIRISTQDITTKVGCQNIINEANSLAPVDAIFNLAVVLKDAILENQTEETFKVSFGPKALATQHLDEASRVMCPELRNFVVFSSVSCGRGNAGQTNYGMSNSVMERICEKRRKDGYPSLAIQWGAVGDVGLVADMQEEYMVLEIGGTLQQSISNCLQVMDVLMTQNEAAIVSSMVVAEKKSSSLTGSITNVVSEILGIRDIKSISLHSTLAELGMDSMTGVEVKQTLEREFNIFLSPTEIRSTTLASIQEMYEGNSTLVNGEIAIDPINWGIILKELVENEEQQIPISKLRSLHTTKSQETLPLVLVFPGMEGVCELLQGLIEKLEVQAFGLNYILSSQKDTIPAMADVLIPHIQALLRPQQTFHILAHSMGANVALEVLKNLEDEGHLATVTFIDGSPLYLKALSTYSTKGDDSDASIENMLIENMLHMQLSAANVSKVMEDVSRCSILEGKLALLTSNFQLNERLTKAFINQTTIAVIKRIKACLRYNPSFRKLKSKATLFKPTYASAKMETEDYGLGQYFDEAVEVKVFDGTHATILENNEVAEALTKSLNG